ncbi:MAG TPA: DUF1553 domain-containing protein, partial [Tepidisphaeraceae bacterium]|nr:DUF1553 domain-containing protein [Tepidisphaeraceae bacterium]
AFVLSKLLQNGMAFSPEADRRTLIRRVSYDLTGLPPSPNEVAAFLADPDPNAYEKLVDRLLASPRYGERWARHWLDAVHYGDTHGYDKDKVRPNAWPYRDYVIRAFNEDKPYSRFVKEQLAGDYFYPDTTDGVVALGMIVAGPFDFVGQVEVRDGTIDKTITRNLDRDDMVTTTMNTFVSLTVQCARCHNHKFDPITQEDYYSLQAVFAGVDRADRPYDPDPAIAKSRFNLERHLTALGARKAGVLSRIPAAVRRQIAQLDQRIARVESRKHDPQAPEFGYHSALSATPDRHKWVQVDLGSQVHVRQVVFVGAHDDFNNIGDGFGFPVRFKIEASDDPTFGTGVIVLADRTRTDFPNPGVRPQPFAGCASPVRYIRVTATRLAPRLHDYMFALGELMVMTDTGENAALGKRVTALDSIEAPVRWSTKNLVDGRYFGQMADPHEIEQLQTGRQALITSALSQSDRNELTEIDQAIRSTQARVGALPKPQPVFAAASEFAPSGTLTPTHGKGRPIYVLARGSEKSPGKEVGPGTVGFLPGLQSRFDLPSDAPEARRRAALAEWIVDRHNPLTWRSIVNRVWERHFGRGIVDTPNDFGYMGATPTHPELLDWLATQFRDGGQWIRTPQSLKELHRLIVTSTTYRQSSAGNAHNEAIDAGNQYLWRQNRQRLDAEAVRDTVLMVSGKLSLTIGGPGFMTCGFEDDHSPRYKYAEFDPDSPASLRRSVYRLTVRSVPDPFMESLDCADASQLVPRRNETLTALQALALLNDKFMVRMSEHFADRARAMAPNDLAAQINAAYQAALCRPATVEEIRILRNLAQKDGMANVCRVIFNCNEFLYVD